MCVGKPHTYSSCPYANMPVQDKTEVTHAKGLHGDNALQGTRQKI